MPESRNDNDGGAGDAVDFGLVLVVGSSSVTRVVVSRIAEGAGLRADCHTPEEAPLVIDGRLPAIAILDGGADGRDCDGLVLQFSGVRRVVGQARAPLLILLDNGLPTQGLPTQGRPHDGIVDVVLGKPVTPDRLQPIIRDMMDRLRS